MHVPLIAFHSKLDNMTSQSIFVMGDNDYHYNLILYSHILMYNIYITYMNHYLLQIEIETPLIIVIIISYHENTSLNYNVQHMHTTIGTLSTHC